MHSPLLCDRSNGLSRRVLNSSRLAGLRRGFLWSFLFLGQVQGRHCRSLWNRIDQLRWLVESNIGRNEGHEELRVDRESVKVALTRASNGFNSVLMILTNRQKKIQFERDFF